jgi:hypothetical protein
VKRGGGQRLSNTDNIFAAAALNVDSCNLTAFGDSIYFPRAAAADLSKKLLRIAGFSPASPQPPGAKVFCSFFSKRSALETFYGRPAGAGYSRKIRATPPRHFLALRNAATYDVTEIITRL